MTKKGKYGIDAPYVTLIFSAIGLSLTMLGLFLIVQGYLWAYIIFIYGILWLLLQLVNLHTTYRGKFNIWDNIFNHLDIHSDAKILDLGCGRGAVLLMAAKRLGNHGEAVGIDLWQSMDQSGNNINVTKHNAVLEGVSEKVKLETGNMMDLPFSDNYFDYVTAGLTIHNTKNQEERKKTLREAYRVIKKGGTLVITDYTNSKEYVEVLKSMGMRDVQKNNAGWQGWSPGPWVPTHIVMAKKY